MAWLPQLVILGLARVEFDGGVSSALHGLNASCKACGSMREFGQAAPPKSAAILVTSLFSVRGKRPWQSYLPWMGGLAQLEAPLVLFGDSTTVPAVRSTFRQSKHTFLQELSFKELECHIFDGLYTRVAHLDPKPSHNVNTFCLWHQKIYFLSAVDTCASPSSSMRVIWIDAGSFRFPHSPYHAWPDNERIALVPKNRILMPLYKLVPREVAMLRGDGTSLAHSSNVFMSARVFGGARRALKMFVLWYFADMMAASNSTFKNTEAAMMSRYLLQHPDKVALIVPPEESKSCRPSFLDSAGLVHAWYYPYSWLARQEESRCLTLTKLLLPKSPTPTWTEEQLSTRNTLPALPSPLATLSNAHVATSTCKSMHGFAFATPSCEVQRDSGLTISGTLANHWEMTALFEALMSAGSQRKVFLDVGMNLGFYTVMARSKGFHTVSIDVQRDMATYLANSLLANGLDLSLSQFYLTAVMNSSRGDTLTVRNRPGKSSQNAHLDLRAGSNTARLDTLKVPVSRLDDLIQQRVMLAKIDVEGCEVSALQGAMRLFADGLVENVFVEFGGYERWSRCGNTPTEAVDVLDSVQHAGYSIHVLEMWKQPSTKVFQNSRHPFWKVAATWPVHTIPVQISPPADAFTDCPRTWCELDTHGHTVGREGVNTSVVKLIEVKDVRNLVTHMAQIDFNLLLRPRNSDWSLRQA